MQQTHSTCTSMAFKYAAEAKEYQNMTSWCSEL